MITQKARYALRMLLLKFQFDVGFVTGGLSSEQCYFSVSISAGGA